MIVIIMVLMLLLLKTNLANTSYTDAMTVKSSGCGLFSS